VESGGENALDVEDAHDDVENAAGGESQLDWPMLPQLDLEVCLTPMPLAARPLKPFAGDGR
jgi:hypothetical protein